MKRKIFTRLTAVLLILLSLTVSAFPSHADRGLPVLQGEVKARLPELFDSPAETGTKVQKLQVGGDPFGIRLFTEGVLVVGVSDKNSPAAGAGIQKHDVIQTANGEDVRTVEQLTHLIENSDGRAITLSFRRNGENKEATVTPVKDDNGKYRIGVWIRDNAAGIGTVTFLDPSTGAFGGLGHGICDTDTGELLPLARGAVMDAEIYQIVRGTEGTPGELRGLLGSEKIGTILKNSDKGVFGILTKNDGGGEVMEIGSRDSVHAGAAILRCSLGEEGVRDYRIELSDVSRENKGTKCFAIHVTDPDLIAKTGGIIQGMSGSPILQDGRLVGAVTHVLIGDPTRGYGIFLENMLTELSSVLS